MCWWNVEDGGEAVVSWRFSHDGGHIALVHTHDPVSMRPEGVRLLVNNEGCFHAECPGRSAQGARDGQLIPGSEVFTCDGSTFGYLLDRDREDKARCLQLFDLAQGLPHLADPTVTFDDAHRPTATARLTPVKRRICSRH